LPYTAHEYDSTIQELYALANFVHPGILGERNHFRDYYARPIEAARDKHALKDDRVLAQDRRDQLSKVHCAIDDLLYCYTNA
jgi:SNF2 family DNA or RNA helicase